MDSQGSIHTYVVAAVTMPWSLWDTKPSLNLWIPLCCWPLNPSSWPRNPSVTPTNPLTDTILTPATKYQPYLKPPGTLSHLSRVIKSHFQLPNLYKSLFQSPNPLSYPPWNLYRILKFIMEHTLLTYTWSADTKFKNCSTHPKLEMERWISEYIN